MKRRRRPHAITAKSIEQLIKAGRGAGELANYKGWVRYTDFTSEGVSGPQPGAKTGRDHDVLSRGEKAYLKILDWSACVVDINENYPALPWQETVSLAERYGLRHPVDRDTRHPWVLTSDFRIIVRTADGTGTRVVVRTVKKREDLNNPDVLVKLEIERLYWAVRGVDWGIIVAEDVPEALVKNIHWIHDMLRRPVVSRGDRTAAVLTTEEIAWVEKALRAKVQLREQPLNQITAEIDGQLALSAGTALNVVRLLIAQRLWRVNMHEEINPDQPLNLLGVAA